MSTLSVDGSPRAQAIRSRSPSPLGALVRPSPASTEQTAVHGVGESFVGEKHEQSSYGSRYPSTERQGGIEPPCREFTVAGEVNRPPTPAKPAANAPETNPPTRKTKKATTSLTPGVRHTPPVGCIRIPVGSDHRRRRPRTLGCTAGLEPTGQTELRPIETIGPPAKPAAVPSLRSTTEPHPVRPAPRARRAQTHISRLTSSQRSP